MNMNKKQWVEIVYGAALIAACSGKLAVDDATNASNSSGGSGGEAANGGAGGSPGDASALPGSGGDPNGGTGGTRYATGGYPSGGAPMMLDTGGVAGCFSGPEVGTGGVFVGGTGGTGPGVTPTCPLDGEGFATVDLATMCGVPGFDGGSARGPAPYNCPATSAALLKGLQCDEVTTERKGFTKTVGCGFETIEFQSYESRQAYDLEHKYAASYDLATGALVGLVVKESYQFEPCMSYAYRAGAVPADCPSAVTYKCTHAPLGGPGDSAYQGCRAPGETGCAQCCDAYAPDSCNVYEAANGSTSYQTSASIYHACRCDCQPCAHCTLESERELRTHVIPHPECNCALPPTGDPCGSWCANKPTVDERCPGLF